MLVEPSRDYLLISPYFSMIENNFWNRTSRSLLKCIQLFIIQSCSLISFRRPSQVLWNSKSLALISKTFDCIHMPALWKIIKSIYGLPIQVITVIRKLYEENNTAVICFRVITGVRVSCNLIDDSWFSTQQATLCIYKRITCIYMIPYGK